MADFADRLDHALVDAVIHDIADELTVDLQIVDGQILEVGERRQTAAEVVERELAAEGLQRLHEVNNSRQIRYGRRLGDLETDRAPRQLLFRQLPSHELEEAVLGQGGARQVDGQRVARVAVGVTVGQLGERGMNHPAIERRHEIVSLRRRDELIRADELAALVTHPEKEFVVAALVAVLVRDTDDRLVEEFEPALFHGARDPRYPLHLLMAK